MPIDNEKQIQDMERRLRQLEHALLSMTGVLRLSTDAKVREGANHFHAVVKTQTIK